MKKRIILILFLMGCVMMCASCFENKDKKDGDSVYFQLQGPEEGDLMALVKTSLGDIYIKLFPEQAPKAVENFTTHAKEGYYDGVIFHRVMNDFMIQSGDPTGSGSGGESIYGAPFEDEVNVGLYNIRGALSMANSGPKTNGSQFFIVQNTGLNDDLKNEFQKAFDDANAETSINAVGKYKLSDRFPAQILEYYINNGGTPHLDYPGINYGYKHTVFGQVVEGMDVVDAIAAVETRSDRPVGDVVIYTIEISEYSGK